MADIDDKLLVFISWSRDLSREVAKALKHLVLIVFDPVVNPWMSDQDIELGSRSMEDIGDTLDLSSFGIIVVTRANQQSQWINFEAGALSKRVGDPSSSVIPLLVDFESPTDLSGPLAQFQATVYNRDAVLRIMRVIATRVGIAPAVLDHRFSTHWDDFDSKVQAARKTFPEDVPKRSDQDKTDEILSLLRSLSNPSSVASGASVARSRRVSSGGPVQVRADRWAEKPALEVVAEFRAASDVLRSMGIEDVLLTGPRSMSFVVPSNMTRERARQIQKRLMAEFPTLQFEYIQGDDPKQPV